MTQPRAVPKFSLAAAIYYLGVASLFGWVAYGRFTLPSWPFGDPDSWGYLRPAIVKLSGGPFVHTNGRNFLYPGFLFLILAAAKSFKAITVVQHVLGLGSGALLLCCWNKLGRFLRAVPLPVHRFLGLGVVSVYLLYHWPVYFEHDLRPESITPFFAILNILLTLIFFERRQREGPSNSLTFIASALLVNSVLLATLKTSFALTVLFSVVPVVLALTDRRENWPRRAAVLAVGVLAVAAVTFPERALAKIDPVTPRFMAESLFCIHANLIVRQIDEDLARGECSARGCDWLREFARRLHDEMAKSWAQNQGYKSFGFDPDYLLYEESLSTFTEPFFAGSYEKQLEFYRYYYWRTLRQHPERMLAKVMSQLRLFYTWGDRRITHSSVLRLAYFYERSTGALEDHGNEGPPFPPFKEYLAKCRDLTSSTEGIVPPRPFRFIHALLANLYVPTLLCVLAVTAAFPFAPRLRHLYGPLALTILFLFSYNFGNCLGTAIVHSLHVLRYTMAQYSFTVLSECAALIFLIDVALHFVGLRMRRVEAPPWNADVPPDAATRPADL